LTEQGTLVINVARILDDRRLVNALYTTIQAVYPSVYIVDLPDTLNSIIFATRQPTRIENLALNYLALDSDASTPSLLMETLQTTVLGLQSNPPETILFTDDRASVEWITNDMIFGLFKSGQLETLH